MNNRAVTLSMLIAVFAVVLMNNYISGVEESAQRKFGVEVTVLVAKKDIPEMSTIDESSFAVEVLPKKFVQPSAISFDEPIDKQKMRNIHRDLVGTVAVVPIKKGEQITANKISEPSIRTGLSPQISPGKRAVAIPVDEFTGVAKLIKPGDHIDLIAILPVPDGKPGAKVARTVLQDVSVLAVGRYVSGNIGRKVKESSKGNERVKSLETYDGFISVTVELPPPQAQLVGLLINDRSSRLMLTLRNSDDSEKPSLSDVFNGDISEQRRPAGKR